MGGSPIKSMAQSRAQNANFTPMQGGMYKMGGNQAPQLNGNPYTQGFQYQFGGQQRPFYSTYNPQQNPYHEMLWHMFNNYPNKPQGNMQMPNNPTGNPFGQGGTL